MMALRIASSSAKMADWSPNDWPESFPELRTIDNLLRCSICYEYFNVALMIPECCHNYCSLCIRKSLGFETQCPTCSTSAVSTNLRNNRVLDELVKNFVKIRVRLLDLIKNNVDKKATEKSIPKEKQEVDQVKRGKVKRPQETPSRNTKRQKIDTTPITRNNRVNTHDDVLVIDDSPPATPTAMPQSQQRSPSGAVGSAALSECPVCGEMINHNKINSHLDLCLVRSEKKSALRREPGKSNVKAPITEYPKPSGSTGEGSSAAVTVSTSSESKDGFSGSNAFVKNSQKRRPLPKLVYELMSERKLRQQLKEWSLPPKGDRQTLIKRHQEFVVRYNAECDALNPKSAAEIAQDIEKTEKAKTRHVAKLSSSTSTRTNLHFTRESTEEEMDKARQQYLKEHQDDFAKLIEDVKKRREKNPFHSKRNKEKPTDVASDQTKSAEVSRTSQDRAVTPPKSIFNMETKGGSPQHEDQKPSFSKQDKDSENGKHDQELLLPQFNESESKLHNHDENETETLPVIPEPPSSASLASFQDEDLGSTPSLGFEEDDQECCELDEDAELFPESSSPVIQIGRASDKDDDDDDDDDTEEFEF